MSAGPGFMTDEISWLIMVLSRLSLKTAGESPDSSFEAELKSITLGRGRFYSSTRPISGCRRLLKQHSTTYASINMIFVVLFLRVI